MNRFVRHLAWLAAGVAAASALGGGARTVVQAAAPEPAGAGGGPVKAIVVTGGHGFDKKAFPEVFTSLANIQCTFWDSEQKKQSVFETIDDWPYDVVVLYNFNRKLTDAQKANFLKLLDKGVGLVILHHAIAAYPGWPEWQKILGARYYLQPTEIDGVKYARSVYKHGVDMKVHVEDADSPITRGMKDFVINDETYGKWTYLPEGSRLLLSTETPGSNKQLAWTRQVRKSPVFFMQLGHGKEAYENPAFRHLVGQAICWSAGRLKTKEQPEPKKPAPKRGGG